jgi:hypothetical protein
VGIVNRSQEDINKNVDMIAARKREREFFATNPDYAHLASKMGSEYLARLLSKVCTRPCIIYSVGWAGFFGYFFLVTFHIYLFTYKTHLVPAFRVCDKSSDSRDCIFH